MEELNWRSSNLPPVWMLHALPEACCFQIQSVFDVYVPFVERVFHPLQAVQYRRVVYPERTSRNCLHWFHVYFVWTKWFSDKATLKEQCHTNFGFRVDDPHSYELYLGNIERKVWKTHISTIYGLIIDLTSGPNSSTGKALHRPRRGQGSSPFQIILSSPWNSLIWLETL